MEGDALLSQSIVGQLVELGINEDIARILGTLARRGIDDRLLEDLAVYLDLVLENGWDVQHEIADSVNAWFPDLMEQAQELRGAQLVDRFARRFGLEHVHGYGDGEFDGHMAIKPKASLEHDGFMLSFTGPQDMRRFAHEGGDDKPFLFMPMFKPSGDPWYIPASFKDVERVIDTGINVDGNTMMNTINSWTPNVLVIPDPSVKA